MKNEEIPDSYQEYLETILRITYKTNKESVKTSEIAKKLNVKAPSVTEMLDKLKKKDLINYQKRKGVTLTEKGRKVG
ncbi:MAG: metal-dependent transcriptional regulator, partial [Candidatus Helarchaeota archaeon]